MVVALIIISILLVAINTRALTKNKDTKSFQNTLDNTERNIKDYEVEIGKLRREFSETITELQIEINELKDKGNLNSEKTEVKVEKHENNIRVNEIETLLKKGLTVDEIANKLNIGKGEVILIKELYIK